MIVEVDVFTYEEARLLIGFEVGAIDNGFKNGKEIFSRAAAYPRGYKFSYTWQT